MQNKYSNIFTSSYDPDKVFVLSDYHYLNVQSAVAHTEGLYQGLGLSMKSGFPVATAVPPFDGTAVNSLVQALSSQPSTYYASNPNLIFPTIVDISSSMIFERIYGSSSCPNGKVWAAANMKDATYTSAYATFKPTIDKANVYLKTKMSTGANVITFVDTVLVDMYDNRAYPGGMPSTLVPSLVAAYSWFVYHQEYAQLIQRQVSAYYPVTEILSQLAAQVNGKSSAYNAVIYSGNTYNLYAILAAFGVVTEDCLMANYRSLQSYGGYDYPNCVFPVFSSSIVIELYNPTGSARVKFYYNNNLINFCAGTDGCPYNDFVTLAKNSIGNLSSSTFKTKCNY